MTPYAVLLCKPNDPDAVIRKAYLRFAELNHPDKNNGVEGADWQRAVTAYNAIKTLEKRVEWGRKQELLANLCTECDGMGVKGTRMFKGSIKICSVCKGVGREQ